MYTTSLDTAGHSIVPQSVPPKPGKKARRAKRNQHRGVLLIAPTPPKNPSWRVRFRDPETQRVRVQTLGVFDAQTAETREAFALKLHKTLSRRRDDIAGGASPHVQADMLLSRAFEKYFEDNTNELRARTLRAYRDPCDDFIEWATAHHLLTVRQLSRGKLKEFAAHAARQPSARGGSLSPRTVKKTLRAVAIVLNWLYDAEVTRLGRDDVRVGLRTRKAAGPEKRRHLEPAQIAELLVHASAHDAICFKATRAEHAANAPGTTPRYAAIAPVIRFLLLSGLRLGELVTLRVGDVHLAHGHFDVRAVSTKTKRARTVKLEYAPSMAEALRTRTEGRDADDLVFAEHTHGSLAAAMRRLQRKYPAFSYQLLRVTCATYLANLPGVGVVNESFQLGHEIKVAQDFYLGRVRLDPAAKTLEQVMRL